LSVGDQPVGEFEESFMDIGSVFPSDAEAFDAVQPGKAALYRPAVDARPGSVGSAMSRDGRHDA